MRKPRELSKNFKHIKSSDLFMQSSCGQEITQKTTDRELLFVLDKAFVELLNTK